MVATAFLLASAGLATPAQAGYEAPDLPNPKIVEQLKAMVADLLDDEPTIIVDLSAVQQCLRDLGLHFELGMARAGPSLDCSQLGGQVERLRYQATVLLGDGLATVEQCLAAQGVHTNIMLSGDPRVYCQDLREAAEDVLATLLDLIAGVGDRAEPLVEDCRAAVTGATSTQPLVCSIVLDQAAGAIAMATAEAAAIQQAIATCSPPLVAATCQLLRDQVGQASAQVLGASYTVAGLMVTAAVSCGGPGSTAAQASPGTIGALHANCLAVRRMTAAAVPVEVQAVTALYGVRNLCADSALEAACADLHAQVLAIVAARVGDPETPFVLAMSSLPRQDKPRRNGPAAATAERGPSDPLGPPPAPVTVPLNMTEAPYDMLLAEPPALAMPTTSMQAMSMQSMSMQSTLMQETFSGPGLDYARWNVLNWGAGIAVQNQRLEMTVQEQGASTAAIVTNHIGVSFGSTTGIDANMQMARHIAGAGFVARPEFRIQRSDNANAWVSIVFNPWYDRVELRDSYGTNLVLSTDGGATGYRNVRIVATTTGYTGWYEGASASVSTSLFSGATGIKVHLQDWTGGSTSGLTETSARDNLYVYSYAEYTNTAPNTPSAPSGPTAGNVGAWLTYTATPTDPDGNSVRCVFSWGDGTAATYTGYVASGSTCSAQHAWSSAGNYPVRVYANDNQGASSSWSGATTVAITQPNRAPNTPAQPYGSTPVRPGTTHGYGSWATDPDGNQVRLTFSWGDGTTTTTGWINSGATGTAYHSWPAVGTYQVRVTATDPAGLQSGQSTALSVVVDDTDASIQTPQRPHGPAGTETGTQVRFETRAIDTDGNAVRFLFDWGDGSRSWTGWATNGGDGYMVAHHVYSTTGTFHVRARASDSEGWYSAAWSPAAVIDVWSPGDCPATWEGDNDACSVILMHGYAGGDAAVDAGMGSWNGLKELWEPHFNDVRRVGFYGGECDQEDSAANHGEHYWPDHGSREGETPHHDTDELGYCPQSGDTHDKDTSITHIGFHVAKFVWDDYTSRGKPLSVVSHSMGGLVMRYATAQVSEHHPSFPSYLDLETVVTVATPHDGAKVNWCTWPNREQAQQMCSSSGFQTWLREHARSGPQASGSHTKWAVYGSHGDEWVSGRSAMYMYSDTATIYGRLEVVCGGHGACGTTCEGPTCYRHTDYYQDLVATEDAFYTYGPNHYENGNYAGPETEWNEAPHFGHDARYALTYSWW